MEKTLGIEGLTHILGSAPFRILNPILIKAWRDRAAARSPSAILREYEGRSEFYGISSINQRELTRYNSLFHSSLPEFFDSVELSPISPFGLNSSLTALSQDVILPTIRGSEVIGDPTTPLALECAVRRKKLLVSAETRENEVHLATAQRVMRLQPFDKTKGYMQHFDLFGLCSAGRNQGNSSVSADFLAEHVRVWLNFVDKLKSSGFTFDSISVHLSDVGVMEAIIKAFEIPRETVYANSLNEDFDLFAEYKIPLPRSIESVAELDISYLRAQGLEKIVQPLSNLERLILMPLQDERSSVRFRIDLSRKAGLGYYADSCYHIFATNAAGKTVQLADGGSVDWVEQFLSSKKERSVTSGFGAELVHKLFVAPSNETDEVKTYD
jgi:hypothetical protein